MNPFEEVLFKHYSKEVKKYIDRTLEEEGIDDISEDALNEFVESNKNELLSAIRSLVTELHQENRIAEFMQHYKESFLFYEWFEDYEIYENANEFIETMTNS